jgi:hypothetical protein
VGKGPEQTVQASNYGVALSEDHLRLPPYTIPDEPGVVYHFTGSWYTGKLVFVKVDRVGKHVSPIGYIYGPYSDSFEIKYVKHGDQEIPETSSPTHTWLFPTIEAQFYIQRYNKALEEYKTSNLSLIKRISKKFN